MWMEERYLYNKIMFIKFLDGTIFYTLSGQINCVCLQHCLNMISIQPFLVEYGQYYWPVTRQYLLWLLLHLFSFQGWWQAFYSILEILNFYFWLFKTHYFFEYPGNQCLLEYLIHCINTSMSSYNLLALGAYSPSINTKTANQIHSKSCHSHEGIAVT